MVFIDHKDIIVELWRANIPDPQGRHSSNSESFTATGGQTTFVPTPTVGTPTISLQAVDTVKVDSVLKDKWRDYLIDLQTGSIIFRTALAGGETVDIDYQEGSTSWIYPDKPREDLGVSSFPRISLFTVGMDGKRLGQEISPADIEYDIHYQADAWAKENKKFTIDGRVYEGDALTGYLTQKAMDVLRQKTKDMYPVLYDFRPITGPRDIPRDEILQALHSLIEFSIKIINIGEDL